MIRKQLKSYDGRCGVQLHFRIVFRFFLPSAWYNFTRISVRHITNQAACQVRLDTRYWEDQISVSCFYFSLLKCQSRVPKNLKDFATQLTVLDTGSCFFARFNFLAYFFYFLSFSKKSPRLY